MQSRRIIVTGGATNIGRAITEKFLAQGARVVVGQPDPSVARSLVERHGSRVVVLPVDVGEPEQCRRFVDAAAAELGGLDVLVNNAAITGAPAMAALNDVNSADFDRMIRVNLGGVLFCTQAAAHHLRTSGGGVVVHVSSINAFRPQQGAMVYAATKAGVSSLARSMARELAPDHIRVVAVAPGDIRVDHSEQMETELSRRGETPDILSQTPLGRGEPADIAEAVAFLASDAAKFVTGVTWLVDGGLLA